jgi:hypothetical protein
MWSYGLATPTFTVGHAICANNVVTNTSTTKMAYGFSLQSTNSANATYEAIKFTNNIVTGDTGGLNPGITNGFRITNTSTPGTPPLNNADTLVDGYRYKWRKHNRSSASEQQCSHAHTRGRGIRYKPNHREQQRPILHHDKCGGGRNGDHRDDRILCSAKWMDDFVQRCEHASREPHTIFVDYNHGRDQGV